MKFHETFATLSRVVSLTIKVFELAASRQPYTAGFSA